MTEQIFTIIDEAGIHARPATVLVQAATKFKSDINLEYKGRRVNLESILGVLSLGVVKGGQIKISATGSDEIDVLKELNETLKNQKLID
ncbi:phosphocarrier protein HPr [Neobacillus pocheonensis]|uniref:Phosphocarrier protein HPr n=1 Tax=Neobacillus pocheonensis TaxID=363869 RepID=A0ABT0W7M0_9BACI|nr:phosphocarrier protein HPr [Neobacillus pocheonensis]